MNCASLLGGFGGSRGRKKWTQRVCLSELVNTCCGNLIDVKRCSSSPALPCPQCDAGVVIWSGA